MKKLKGIFDAGAGDFVLTRRIAFIGVLFIPISIGGMQLFLCLAGISWISIILIRKRKLYLPPFYPYLLLFCFFSLVSLVFSLEPAAGLPVFKIIPLILLPLIFYNIIENNQQRDKFLNFVIAGAVLNSSWGLLMYSLGKQHRLNGFLGHYMTAAGILMMVLIFLFSHLITVGFKKFGLPRIIIVLIIGAAFTATFTRSAWVGASIGFVLLFGIIRPRYIPLGLTLLFLMFLFVPSPIKQRIASTFDIHDATIQDRLMMIKTGSRIIKDYPLWGVGPEMVPRVYEEYKAEGKDFRRPHLHNNFFQIAAERGLLTVLSWIGFICAILYYSGKIYNKLKKESLTVISEDYRMIACLAVVISFLIAGLFEYNWGDTEVATAFLFLTTLPFATYKKEFSFKFK